MCIHGRMAWAEWEEHKHQTEILKIFEFPHSHGFPFFYLYSSHSPCVMLPCTLCGCVTLVWPICNPRTLDTLWMEVPEWLQCITSLMRTFSLQFQDMSIVQCHVPHSYSSLEDRRSCYMTSWHPWRPSFLINGQTWMGLPFLSCLILLCSFMSLWASASPIISFSERVCTQTRHTCPGVPLWHVRGPPCKKVQLSIRYNVVDRPAVETGVTCSWKDR